MSGQATATAREPGPPWPVPGAILERGRYRLVSEVGRDDRSAARFWRGLDLVLQRDVALTLFVAPAGNTAAKAFMQSALHRARRSARLVTPGAAQVLDVLESGHSSGTAVAAVVSEWTAGSGLVDWIRTGLPEPSHTAGVLAPLAGAVDAAHRAGFSLGCDHPHRIRVTAANRARFAFPGASPQSGPDDDIRGLGALLYLLLTGYWPLAHGAGPLPPAPVGPDGTPTSPHTLRPEVPVELSTLAMRCLAGFGANGVHTGAAVQRVLELHAIRAGCYSDPSTDVAAADPFSDPEQIRRQRRVRLGLSVAALIGATLLILGYAGSQLASVFAERPSTPLIVSAEPTEPPGAGPAVDGLTAEGLAQDGEVSVPISIRDVSVYDVSGVGTPDNPRSASRILDGDPTTSWSTDAYFQQFPAYKEGLGLMLNFAQPVTVASVTIASPSPGTVVEIRTAPAPDAELADTVLVGAATLRDGVTEIGVRGGEPTRYLLLWITRLSEQGDRIQSRISEVGVQQVAS